MISETKFHPSTELLQEFAAGTLSAGLNIAISAHVEFCELCCHKTSEFEAKAAIDWLQTSEKHSSSDYSDMIAKIVSQPQQNHIEQQDPSLSEIHMLDHSVSLPKVLAKAASNGLVWKKLSGGIKQAQLNIDDESVSRTHTEKSEFSEKKARNLHLKAFSLKLSGKNFQIKIFRQLVQRGNNSP